MKFEVDFYSQRQGKYFHLWMVWKTSNLIFFRGLQPLVTHQGFALDSLRAPRPPAVVFRIFRKIHVHPCKRNRCLPDCPFFIITIKKGFKKNVDQSGKGYAQTGILLLRFNSM
jgi:hypothetical protein